MASRHNTAKPQTHSSQDTAQINIQAALIYTETDDYSLNGHCVARIESRALGVEPSALGQDGAHDHTPSLLRFLELKCGAPLYFGLAMKKQ